MLVILSAILGGALYRFRGASHPLKRIFRRPISQMAFALSYAFIAYQAVGWWGLAVLPLTTLALLTGHGNFFLRGTGGDDETIEFLVKWLKPYLPLYWYRAVGMSMTGMLVSLPCGIATLNPFIALSGLLKGVGYVMADQFKMGDAAPEYLTGFFLWGTLAYLVL